MSDLAERLFSKSTDGHASDEALYREAAARIEALEAALRDIMMDVEIATPVREFARAALGDQTTPPSKD